MQKNMEATVDFIREISCKIYGKEVFFYDCEKDTWYSRLDGEYVEFESIFERLKNDIFSYLRE